MIALKIGANVDELLSQLGLWLMQGNMTKLLERNLLLNFSNW
jgi:hypothetical protein